MLASKLSSALALALMAGSIEGSPGLQVLGTISNGSKHSRAQSSFKLRPAGMTYPFSSTRQDERQRRQFSRDRVKRAGRDNREFNAQEVLYYRHYLTDPAYSNAAVGISTASSVITLASSANPTKEKS